MKLIATAKTPEEAKQRRFELEQQMAERGLYPELLIGLVRPAARDDAESWGIWYDPRAVEAQGGS